MRIIYKNTDNSVGVLIPTSEAIAMFTNENEALLAIAEKDVPAGLPYWIVEDSAIPEDRTFRDAWEIDETLGEPTGFGGESNEFDDTVLETILAAEKVEEDTTESSQFDDAANNVEEGTTDDNN
jgi:hypothetical protein